MNRVRVVRRELCVERVKVVRRELCEESRNCDDTNTQMLEYKLASDETGLKAAACTIFCTLWRQLTPHLTIMNPTLLLGMSEGINDNTPESEKSQVNKTHT